MSSSKFDLGGSSLLSPKKSQPDLGHSLVSPSKPTSNSPGLNPLTSTSSNIGLTSDLLDSSTPSANLMQVGDLLPHQPGNALDSLAAPSLLEQTTETVNIETTDSQYVVHLSSVGAGKVAVVKAIRAHWGTGLKRSKELADAAPTDLPALPEAKAQAAQVELSNLGAMVKLQRAEK